MAADVPVRFAWTGADPSTWTKTLYWFGRARVFCSQARAFSLRAGWNSPAGEVRTGTWGSGTAVAVAEGASEAATASAIGTTRWISRVSRRLLRHWSPPKRRHSRNHRPRRHRHPCRRPPTTLHYPSSLLSLQTRWSRLLRWSPRCQPSPRLRHPPTLLRMLRNLQRTSRRRTHRRHHHHRYHLPGV